MVLNAEDNERLMDVVGDDMQQTLWIYYRTPNARTLNIKDTSSNNKVSGVLPQSPGGLNSSNSTALNGLASNSIGTSNNGSVASGLRRNGGSSRSSKSHKSRKTRNNRSNRRGRQ